jgi:hypothetical protein
LITFLCQDKKVIGDLGQSPNANSVKHYLGYSNKIKKEADHD